nr:hypothetical protein [Candidatus Blastococcus massiliensis]
MDVLAQQQGGSGVPAVVQPDVPDAGLLQQPRPVVVVGLLVDRPAVGLGEDQVLVVPLGAGQHPLAELGGLVPVQLGDERHRQCERALAAAGLGLLVDQPAAPDAVDAPPHGESACERVDVLPLQRQGFGLSEAEGESDGPAGGVADVRGGSQDGARLAEVEGGGDVARALCGRVDEGGDVAGHVSALDGDGERPGQNPVVAQHGGGGVAGVEERGVELVEVLGAQPVHPVAADAGNQVPADGGLIALQGPLPHPARGDGGEPVLQPVSDGRGGDGVDGAGVALALQVADLRDDHGAGLAGDVPAVGFAGEGEADGDVTMPAPVGVLVDRRLTVRRAPCHGLSPSSSVPSSFQQPTDGRPLLGVDSVGWSTGVGRRGPEPSGTAGGGASSRLT